ncbi:MAG: hypothetical protein IKY31_00890 [Bacteroidaceae bacterium]|nr:hypothetical protein [Bacteroidaceae bacterium]
MNKKDLTTINSWIGSVLQLNKNNECIKYDKRIESLINTALADGILTEKEKQILFKNAQIEGIDLDEFEMVLDARLVELGKEEIATSSTKSNKLGEVIKCPACGAYVNSYQRKCPECDYTFEKIIVNSSVSQFSEILRKSNFFDKKKMVSSFPIPSSKSDLIEFITILHPYVFNNDETFDTECSETYISKYKECVEKIKVYFPNDEILSRYIKEFEKAVKFEKIKKSSMDIEIWSCVGGYFVGIAIMMYVAYLNDYSIWGYIGMFFVGVFLGLFIGYTLEIVLKIIYKMYL